MNDFRDDKCPCGLPWSECPWNIMPYACPEWLSTKIAAAPPEDVIAMNNYLESLLPITRSDDAQPS